MSNTAVRVFTQTYSSTTVVFNETYGFTTINFNVKTGTATITGSLASNGVPSNAITLNPGESFTLTSSTNLILTGITLTCTGDIRVTAIQ